jgi:hypothetical protein
MKTFFINQGDIIFNEIKKKNRAAYDLKLRRKKNILIQLMPVVFFSSSGVLSLRK